jgi:hypothetical protein
MKGEIDHTQRQEHGIQVWRKQSTLISKIWQTMGDGGNEHSEMWDKIGKEVTSNDN